MEKEPGNPIAYVVVVLVGFMVLAVGTVLASGTAMDMARQAGGEIGRNGVIAQSIQAWAKLLMGCGLLMFGFARQQPAALRAGALVAGALMIAG